MGWDGMGWNVLAWCRRSPSGGATAHHETIPHPWLLCCPVPSSSMPARNWRVGSTLRPLRLASIPPGGTSLVGQSDTTPVELAPSGGWVESSALLLSATVTAALARDMSDTSADDGRRIADDVAASVFAVAS